jgi:hypothetical protein
VEEDFDERTLRTLLLSELQAELQVTEPSVTFHTGRWLSTLNNRPPAANEPSYPQPVQNIAIPDHSGANKSAKSEHFSLFLRILSKRHFWHAITLITALALGFVASWLLFPPVTKQAPPHT